MLIVMSAIFVKNGEFCKKKKTEQDEVQSIFV